MSECNNFLPTETPKAAGVKECMFWLNLYEMLDRIRLMLTGFPDAICIIICIISRPHWLAHILFLQKNPINTSLSLCLSMLHVCLSHGDTVYRQCTVQPNNGEQACSPFWAYRRDTNSLQVSVCSPSWTNKKWFWWQGDGRKSKRLGLLKHYIRVLL